MTGYVYAIGNDEFVKIGFSTKPILRASKIQSDTAFECKLLGFVEATRAQEAELHSLLLEYRHNREWFHRGSAAVECFIYSVQLNPRPSYSARKPRGKDKLSRYLDDNNLTDTAFARTVGVSSEAIRRYRDGRVPTPFVMEKIIKATDEQVMPNDFFDGRVLSDDTEDTA